MPVTMTRRRQWKDRDVNSSGNSAIFEYLKVVNALKLLLITTNSVRCTSYYYYLQVYTTLTALDLS